jgi:hypothetical protein
VAGNIWDKGIALCRAVANAARNVIRLNAAAQNDLPSTPMRLRWLNLVAVALTLAAVWLAYQEGLRQKMNQVAPDAVDMLAETVGVEISQRFHGTHGYVGRTEVLEKLFQGGFTGRQNYLDNLKIKYPDNSEMPELINKAISEALKLKDLPADATFGNQRLYAPSANDPGFVEYVGLAFELFGWNVEAFYSFYFAILIVSVGLFILCYHADTLPLLVLSAVLVALLTLLDTQFFSNVNVRTLHNQRFLGSLCLVPYLHLFFAILLYRKVTWWRVAVTVLQAAVLTFLMFARSSAFWMILSLAAVIGVNAYFRLGRSYVEAKMKRFANLALSWPSFLIVGGLVASLAYKSETLHPIYSLDVYIPYHMIWHNAYMGLGLHPEWNERGDKHKGKPISAPGSDHMAYEGAVAEAETYYGITESYLNNNVLGGYAAPRMRLHEKLIRDRFLRFAFHNPRFVLEVYLWYKPKLFFQELARTFTGYRWTLGPLLCQIVFLALGVAMWRLLDIPRDVRRTLAAGILVTGVMSTIPIVWTYPWRHVAGEQFLILITIVLYFASSLLSMAWSRVGPLVLRHA